MTSMLCFCAALVLVGSKSAAVNIDEHVSRPVRSEVELTSECSSEWNVATQLFDTTVSWIRIPASSSHNLHLDYPGTTVILSFELVNNDSYNYPVTPIVPDGIATYQIDSGAVTRCYLSLIVPPAEPIQTTNVLAVNITLQSNTTLAEVEHFSIAFPTPDSPTGITSDLAYEVMFGADDMLTNATDIYMLTDITTAESTQTGRLDVTVTIPVMPNITVLFFQIRPIYNITLSNNRFTIVSNWSSSQPINLIDKQEGLPSVSISTIVPSFTNSFSTGSAAASIIAAATSGSSIITTTSITNTSETSGVQATLIGVGVVAFVVIISVVIAAVVICIFCSLKRRPKQTPELLSEGLELQQPQVLLSASKGDKWEVPPQYVDNIRCIGRGGFGKVYEAVVRGYTTTVLDLHIQRNNHSHSVAVKTLKEDATEFDREQFLKEIDLMKTISESSNPHVINMVGSSTLTDPLLLLLEYMQYGDLLSYLKSCRNGHMKGVYSDIEQLQETDIPSFAYQIASGMEYLAHMDLVHRDLACRNVLMDQGRKLKITDFGLSRQVNLESMYIANPKGRFPVRWMAFESIVDREFTTQSDVWSFGVTVWEMGSLGEIPYSSVGNDELLKHIRSGQRLEKPDNYIDDEIYRIMKSCWMVRPADRPTFTQLRKSFDAMLLSGNRQSQYYLEMNPEKESNFSVVELPQHNDTGTLTRSNMYVKIV